MTLSDTAASARPAAMDQPARWPLRLTPWRVLGLLGVFYAVMLALQLVMQTGGRNDDAEQILLSQSLAWGYDPRNPPLTTWLIALAGGVVGPGLAAVRVVLLGAVFLTFIFLWLAARQVIASRALALLAALSPAATLHFAWYPFQNLSHTLMLACCTAATLAAAFAMINRPSWPRAVLFGLAVGAGLLAKYNYALVLGALLLAILCVPAARRRLADIRLWAGLALGAVLALPHYLWLHAHRGIAGEMLQDRWDVGAEPAWWTGVATGLASVVEASLSFLLPMIGIVVLLYWRAFVPFAAGRRPLAVPDRGPARAVAQLHPALMLALLAVAVLGFGVQHFANHHLFILIGASLALFARIETVGAARWAMRAYAGVLAACLAAVLVAYPLWVRSLAETCDKCGPVLPYHAYAEALRDAGFDGHGSLLVLGAVHHFPLEQLRAAFPDVRVSRPEDWLKRFYDPPANAEPGACAVVWPADREPHWQDRLMAGQVADLPPVPETARRGVVTAPLAWSGRDATAMAYVVVRAPGLPGCR